MGGRLGGQRQQARSPAPRCSAPPPPPRSPRPAAVAAAGHGDHLDPARPQHQRPPGADRSGAKDDRRLRLPGIDAALDQLRLPQRLLHDRQRLGRIPIAASAFGTGATQRTSSTTDSVMKPCSPTDAPLGVLMPLAHVRLPRRAGRATVRPPHRGGDQLPRANPSTPVPIAASRPASRARSPDRSRPPAAAKSARISSRSVPQTPTCRMCISTCPGPGAPRGISCRWMLSACKGRIATAGCIRVVAASREAVALTGTPRQNPARRSRIVHGA